MGAGKNKHILRIILVTYATLMGSLLAHAQPVIEWADYYTDYWYDNPSGEDGHHYVVCGYVEGNVTVKVTDGHIFRNMAGGPWYCRFVENDGFTEQSLTITAADQRSNSIRRQTHVLDKIKKMNKATGIKFSDETRSPIVSWNSSKDATRYYLRVIDSRGNEIHRSPPLDVPEYKIPDDIMALGQKYHIRLLNQNYDECSVYEWGLCIENRSSTWVPYTPSK